MTFNLKSDKKGVVKLIFRKRQFNKTRKVVDEAIESVCERVRASDELPNDYAQIVKALAELVKARAQLH